MEDIDDIFSSQLHDYNTKSQELANYLHAKLTDLFDDIDFKEGQRKKINNHLSEKKLCENIYFLDVINDEGKIIPHGFLDENYLTILFDLIFNNNKRIPIYHYTSFNSLFYILESQEIRLSGVCGLNDKTEYQIDDIYYDKKEIKNEHHYKRVQSHNRKYVLSCSHNKDNLNLWRLYGNDGKGVCLKISREFGKGNLRSGNVIYSDSFFKKLNALKEETPFKISLIYLFQEFDEWRNFIKYKDYADEQEYRFFMKTKKVDIKDRVWQINSFQILTPYISLPLIAEKNCFLSEILLGPKCPNKEHNKGQIQEYLRDKGLNISIKVEASKKDHYR